MGNFFINPENFGAITPYLDLFRQGLIVTVLLAFCTVVIGFILALVLALLRMSAFRPFLWLSHAAPKTFGFFERDREGN